MIVAVAVYICKYNTNIHIVQLYIKYCKSQFIIWYWFKYGKQRHFDWLQKWTAFLFFSKIWHKKQHIWILNYITEWYCATLKGLLRFHKMMAFCLSSERRKQKENKRSMHRRDKESHLKPHKMLQALPDMQVSTLCPVKVLLFFYKTGRWQPKYLEQCCAFFWSVSTLLLRVFSLAM